MKSLEWLQHFSIKIFPDTQGQLTPLLGVLYDPIFELLRAFMVVLVTCKNEEDPFKNECARVLSRLYFNCLDTQGQLTPQSVVGSWRSSNLSKILLLSL